MILIHKETGELFELMIASLDDSGLTYLTTASPAYRLGEFTLYNPLVDIGECKYSEIAEKFELLGII